VEISKVEGSAVLSIAKNKIGKSTPERIEMTRKRIVKPTALASPVGFDRALKIGNDQPNSTTGFQYPEAFLKQQIQLIWIKVLEHVRGVNRVNGVGGKWKTISNVQPQIEFMEQVAIYVDETG
jgi:hypothetical protein